jgi:glycosyltransferase involved in cell wall biosynthesis
VLSRVRADLTWTYAAMPIVPNRVDLATVIFCHAAFHEATDGVPLQGNRLVWHAARRFTCGLERWAYGDGRAGALAAASAGAERDLLRHYPGTRVVAMPHGLDLERFRPDADTRRRVRVEHSVGEDEVVAMFVGRDHPGKGLAIAIEAFALARRSRSGPDHLWVLGRGHERLADLVRRAGVSDRVRFLGFRRDIERLYSAADIFVLPTFYETFCYAAHEAAACELPVVAPAVNGIAELVGEDETGIAVEREPAAVARALSTLAGDAGLRARLGKAGRRRCLDLTRERTVRTILEVHERLLAEKHGRAVGGEPERDRPRDGPAR